MNPANYKDLVNSRGYKYHYYAVPAKGDNLTLLLVHGWPNTSRNWRRIVPYFEEQGYGVIVPDMLGYAGSDKPTDHKEYQFSRLTNDLVEILDAEGVKQAVAIGHDLGVIVVSRLANFAPDRFLGYAYLTSPWQAPDANFDIEQYMAQQKAITGYETFGYWYFCAEDGADKIMEDHIESLMSVMWPKVIRAFGATDSLKGALLSGYTCPIADYLDEEDKQYFIDTFRKGGFAGPLCYYKIMVNKDNARATDDATIPESQLLPPVSSPLFFAAARKDPVCLASVGNTVMSTLTDHNVTVKEFDGGHWVLTYPETAKEVGHELHAWLETVVSPVVKARA